MSELVENFGPDVPTGSGTKQTKDEKFENALNHGIDGTLFGNDNFLFFIDLIQT